VTIVDTNVLLYAVNADDPHHAAARTWLERALSGAEIVGFGWVVLLGFIRIATSGAFRTPISADRACGLVDEWLDQPTARVIEPGPGHLGKLRQLLMASGTAGSLVNDAHLATLAFAHRATLTSFDRDFLRFEGLEVVVPRG